MSGVIALANPRRIKASHRRRRRVASDHLLYILNNPLAATDPTGYCTGADSVDQCAKEAGNGGTVNITAASRSAGSKVPQVVGTVTNNGNGTATVTAPNGGTKNVNLANGGTGGQSATGAVGRQEGNSQPQDKASGQQKSTDQLSTGQRVGSATGAVLSGGAAATCAALSGKACSSRVPYSCAVAALCTVAGADIAASGMTEAVTGTPQTPALATAFSMITGVSPETSESGQNVIFALTGGVAALRQPTGVLTFSPAASAASAEIRFYDSFNAFKRSEGAAGPGMAWHHIVEQTPANVLRFGNQAIHNTANLVRLPHGKGTIHNQISAFYSSKQLFTGGQTVRQWVGSKSFDDQMAFGKSIMERFGGAP